MIAECGFLILIWKYWELKNAECHKVGYSRDGALQPLEIYHPTIS